MARGVFVAATTITATALNDGFKPPYCSVYASANISITTSAVAQAITFDTELTDNLSMHSVVSNTSRINVPSGGAGLYLIGGLIRFASNATGYRQVEFRLNGATSLHITRVPTVTTGVPTYVSATLLYPLADFDYVELMAAQSSGGALNAEANGTAGMNFWAAWQAVS